MKKITSLTLCCLLLFSTGVLSVLFAGDNSVCAVAASTYLRVIDKETVFYANPNEQSALFYLPYTYYVKSLGETGGFVHVECYGTNGGAALDGYVKSGKLFDDGLIVNNPFVALNVTTAATSALYSDSGLSSPLQYVFADRNMRYYGSFISGSMPLYYVEYNGKLGYVKEEDVYPFIIPDHPNELTFLPQEEEPQEPDETPADESRGEEDFLSLKVIIVVCLLFAGIVALFFAFKQKPSRRAAAGYYDENDYE